MPRDAVTHVCTIVLDADETGYFISQHCSDTSLGGRRKN